MFGFRHQRPRRGDEDHCAARLAQESLGGARQQERRGEIGVDDAMPFGERQPAQRFADHDAGVGDHCIEPAELFDEHLHRAGNGLFVADIAFDQNDVAIARRESALQSAAWHVDDADAPAGGEQMTRDGAADAVGAAGHQRDGFCFRHASRRRSSIALDGSVGPRAPFRPRAVVEARGGSADRFQRECQDRSRHAGAARRDDRFVEIDAGIGEG